MKTLLIRPGVEIVEKTLRGPWPPELGHLERLYKEPGLLFRAFFTRQTLSNASTLAVGTILRELGEDVECLDIPFEFGIPLTEKLNVKRHKKIAEYIARGAYDVVGISCISALEGVATQRVAEIAKSTLEDVNVIVGGYQATAEALDMMEKIPAIDVIVLSDFEPIAEQLYSSFDGNVPIDNVPNVVYRKNGKIHVSERKYFKMNLEDLPSYDYSLVEKYIPKYSVIAIESSRGCPYNCSFCQEKVVRQSYTVKDVTVAVDELIDAANYIAQFEKHVFLGYCDACWGANLKWVKEFCSQLANRRDEISSDTFAWGLEARIGQFDDEALSLMKKAGCVSMAYGVESLSPKMIKMMNKTGNPQKYIASVFDTVKRMLKVDMQTVMFFILGMPGETPSTIEETLNSVRNIPLENERIHIEFGLAYSLSKTELNNQIHDPQFTEKYGVRILDEYSWEKAYIPRFTLLFNPSRELSASELTEIFLDIIRGTRGIPTPLEKQLETFEDTREILGKDEISPDELARSGKTYIKVTTESKRISTT